MGVQHMRQQKSGPRATTPRDHHTTDSPAKAKSPASVTLAGHFARGSAVERIRGALEGYGSRIHESHGSPTLAVSQGRPGALVKCHAACDTADVLAALGLTWEDMFDQPRERERGWSPRWLPEPTPLAEFKRALRRAVDLMNLVYHEARTPKGPALSAAERLELAEWGEKQDQDAHYWRTLARFAARACDENYVRAAYAQWTEWLRTGKWDDKPSYEQTMVLVTRAEDLERARAGTGDTA
jgi:hypothetical protein